MSALTRAFGLVVSVLLAVSSGCTGDNVPAGQCRYSSDCESPLVCVGTYCRAPCLTDRDCPNNGVCARGLGGVLICAARDAPRPCLYSSDCPATTFCTRDGICQARCRGDYDCQVINPFNTCVEGSCQLVCPSGFADCDGDVRNGCEVDTRSSAQHCGRCANPCVGAAGAPGTCRASACVAPCATGFADCDGSAVNGCEADLSQSEHCGSCASRCSGERGLCLVAMEPGTGARSYSCQPSCPTGTTTCGTRCSDLQSDPSNCGRCDQLCPTGAGATATCEAGRCGLRCAEPTAQGDCDGMAANGCEVELQSQPHELRRLRQRLPGARPRHPGMRGRRLPDRVRDGLGQLRRRRGQRLRDRPDGHRRPLRRCAATPAPRGSTGRTSAPPGSARGACAPGFGDCDGSGGQRLRGDHHQQRRALRRVRAGVRREAPQPPRAARRAPATYRCATGFADCDGDPANGCEVDASTSTAHCGGCGRACSRHQRDADLRRGALRHRAATRASATATATRPTAARRTPPATPSTAARAGTVCSFPGAGARCDRRGVRLARTAARASGTATG